MQVTASNIDLLLSCQRPFDPDVETERSEPGVSANYGSALHAILAGEASEVAAAVFGVSTHLEELTAHAVKAQNALTLWMSGANSFEKTFHVVSREVPTAYSPWTGARACEFDEATHHYVLLPGEIGGTADLVLESADGFRVVLDFKTGDYVNPDVYRNGQLQTLARMHSAHGGVVIMHTPRSSPIQFYVADYDPSHWDRVTAALARIGDGSLRPTSTGCKYCPAKSSCPAFGADIVKEANSLLRLASGAAPLVEPTDAGALHAFLSRFASLEKRARDLIRARVEDGEVIQRPDGKVLGLYPKKFTNLSLTSIRRALPGEDGEKMIETLRGQGCIEEGERLELHAK